MPLKWIISVFVMATCAEAVTLWSVNNKSAVCGEQVTIICSANRTNFITISVDGHGSHTFERNSKKQAILGPFNLNLTRADIDPDYFYLTMFEVISTTNQEYSWEIPKVNCSDAHSSDYLSLEIKSETCFQDSQVAEITTSDEIMLQWEHPTCPGWINLISHYFIRFHDNEGELSHHCSNNTELFLISNASSVVRVNITAINLCMEKVVIKTYVITEQIMEEENATGGHLNGRHNIYVAGTVAGVLAIALVTVTVTVVVGTGTRARKDHGSYKPKNQEEKAGVCILELYSYETAPDSDNVSFMSDQENCDVEVNFSIHPEEEDKVINPHGMVVTNDRIIVTDEDSNEGCADVVRVFNKSFQPMFIIDGPFKNTKGVSVDKYNCIYVADCGNNRIVKFRPEGAYNQQTYPSKSEEMFHPHGLVVHKDLLYVCDPKNSCIVVLDLDLQWKYKLESQRFKMSFTPKHIVYDPCEDNFLVLQEDTHKTLKLCIDTSTFTAQGYCKTAQKVRPNAVKSVATCGNKAFITDANKRVLYFTTELKYIRGKRVKGPCVVAAYNGHAFFCGRKCKKRMDGTFWTEEYECHLA